MSEIQETKTTPGGTAETTSMHPSFMSRYARSWLIVLVAAVVAAGIALGGVALGHGQSTPSGTVTVTGSGSVKGIPDTVDFQVGATTTAPTAAVALLRNNARVASLESTLEGHGVLKKDMQTSGLNIYEDRNRHGVLTGFTVQDSLNVSIRGISRAGSAIDAAVRVVGNGVQFDGVSFSFSSDSSLLAAARAQAMASAHAEASQVAAGGHAALGGIVRVTDQENSASSPFYADYGLSAAAAYESIVPLQAGRQTISIQVTVVYALNS